MSQFKVNNEEGEIVHITPYAGIQHNYCYVLPQKYIDLERGGSNVQSEISFSDVSTLTYLAPPPIDCETIEY